jgi:NMD protein affecting ribosome stability and mRNA decay
MLKGILSKNKTANSVKCIKCGRRDATANDGLCDSCRFTQTIEKIVQTKK